MSVIIETKTAGNNSMSDPEACKTLLTMSLMFNCGAEYFQKID